MGNVTSVVEDLGLNEPDLSSSSANEQPDDSAAHKSLPAHKRWQTDRCYLPNELEKRKQAIEELLSSERNYVRHLGVLCDVFIQPLNCWADELQAQQEAAEEESGRVDRDAQLDVTRAELLTVFSNIEQLAAFNKQLLVELEAAEQAGGPKAMLDAFLKAAPFFKMYMVYVRNFELSRETLNALEGRRAVRIFLKACELQRACHGLQLRDLLITPVQRIPRYKLLLETMLRYTKDMDPLHHRLSENLAQMAVIAETINADVHKMERRNKVLSLQYQFSEDWVSASRLFVKEGPLQKVCRNGTRRFQFVLFNNLLVYGSETLMGKWGKQQYTMNRAIELQQCFIVDCLGGGSSNSSSSTASSGGSSCNSSSSECLTPPPPHTSAAAAAAAVANGAAAAAAAAAAVVPPAMEDLAFMVVSPDKSFVVLAADPVEKAEWVAAIRGAMSVLLSARAKLPAAARASAKLKALSSFASKKNSSSKKQRSHRAGTAAGGGSSSSSTGGGFAEHPHASGRGEGKGGSERGRQEACAVWALGAEGRVTRAGFLLPRCASVHVTFKDLMRSPRQRAAFRAHLQATHCAENLDFYEAALQYYDAAAAGSGGRVAAARAIADRYVKEGAPNQVNLGADMRNRVLTACKDGLCPVDLFAAGAQEVSQILERDSYLRFRATEGFLELLAQLEPDLEPCGMLKFEELSPDPGLAGAPWLRSPPSPSLLVLSPSSSTKSHALPPSSPLTLSPVNLMSPTYTSSSTSSTQNGAVSGAGSTNSGSPYSQRHTPAHRHQPQQHQQQQAHGYMSPRTVAAAIAAIPAPGKPAAAWKMGSNGPVPPPGLPPGPHRVLVVMAPGPEGFGMNLELNDEGRAMVRGFRQLGVGLLNPAQEAGVVLGDVLLECNGFLIDTFDVAVETLKQAGTEPLKLVMRREDGACGERVHSAAQQQLPPPPPAPPQLGSGGGSTSSHFGSAKWRR